MGQKKIGTKVLSFLKKNWRTIGAAMAAGIASTLAYNEGWHNCNDKYQELLNTEPIDLEPEPEEVNE